MKSLLDQITKAYELKQIEVSLNKIENLKKDIQNTHILMPNSIMR